MPFKIIRNDITKVHTDAIVNTASNSLLGSDGVGVDSAIHKAAGEKLLEECKILGGCETGCAKITNGYNMHCKYIIHTVGPVWRGGNNNEENLLYSCYEASLELAKNHECRNIAFPLISAGAYGFPKRKALDISTKAISDFLKHNEMDVTLVVFDRESTKLSGSISDRIQNYIDDIYAEKHYPYRYEQEMRMLNAPQSCVYEPKKKNQADPRRFRISSLEERILGANMTFSQTLLKFIDTSGMNDSEVYKAANISKQVFSKIRSDVNYHPKKITVFAFAIALKLTITQTEELLKSAGYALTQTDKTDIIIGYFIEHGRYNVFEINEVLFDYDLTLLGV